MGKEIELFSSICTSGLFLRFKDYKSLEEFLLFLPWEGMKFGCERFCCIFLKKIKGCLYQMLSETFQILYRL